MSSQLPWHVRESQFCPLAVAEILEQFDYVRHGITMRGTPEEDFNFSFSVAQDKERVRHHRTELCNSLGTSPDRLIVPAQVHGSGVGRVSEANGGRGALEPETAVPGCDALVTNTPGLLLGITIADCLPVFILDPVRRAVGLAHSGWRGTAGRIAVRTLTAMQESFGTRPAECVVAIGPGIGPDGYEVDTTVHEGFAPEDVNAVGVFAPTRPGHCSLDLFAAVRHQLLSAGVREPAISVAPWRTHRDTGLFFSHRLRPGCPRMMAVLGVFLPDPGE